MAKTNRKRKIERGRKKYGSACFVVAHSCWKIERSDTFIILNICFENNKYYIVCSIRVYALYVAVALDTLQKMSVRAWHRFHLYNAKERHMCEHVFVRALMWCMAIGVFISVMLFFSMNFCHIFFPTITTTTTTTTKWFTSFSFWKLKSFIEFLCFFFFQYANLGHIICVINEDEMNDGKHLCNWRESIWMSVYILFFIKQIEFQCFLDEILYV